MPSGTPIMARIEENIPAQGTANAAQDFTIGEAPADGTVTSVSLVSEAAVVAHATNYRTFSLINKGQAGAGTTVIATFATDTVTTDDLAAFDEKALTLSSTAADLNVSEGDILAAVETVAASGVAHAGYRIQVEIKRR